MFIRIWHYRARPDKVAEFRTAYGPAGRWVELFRRAPGYLGTELLAAESEPLAFVTIDRWTSASAWHACFAANEGAYRALDEACTALTEEERDLGSYEVVE